MSDTLKGKEILRIIQAIANEKRLPESVIFRRSRMRSGSH